MILDDIHDAENSSSMGACQKVIDSYYNNLLGRADPQESRFILAGRRWSQWDIYGHLIESGDWVAMRLPAERGPGQTALYYDVYVPPGMDCCFTEGAAQEVNTDNPKYRQFRAYYGVDPEKQGFFWPASEVKRRDYFSVKRNSPAQAAATYQGSPGGNESGVFLESDFRYIPLGNYPAMTPELIPPAIMPPGSRIIQGWDVSHTIGKNADYSVCTTAVLTPSQSWHNGEHEVSVGKPDSHYVITVVDQWVGQVEAGSLIDKIRELHQLWNPSFIAVEKNTGSIPIIQMLANSLPIVPMSLRNSNKKARAVISVAPGTASVQGWMRQGRVRFWSEAPWLQAFRQEMLDFTGDGSGHDDRCFVAGTLISMADGTKRPIESVRVGELVDTPQGPKPVLAAGLTGVEPTWEVQFEGGVLEGTGNHPIYCNDDWVPIDSLPWDGYLSRERISQPWHSSPTQTSESNQFTSEDTSTTGTRTVRAKPINDTSPGQGTCSTGIPGSISRVQSLRDSIFTTLMGTGITMRLRILLAFPVRLIEKSMSKQFWLMQTPQSSESTWRESAQKQPNGTAVQKDLNGTGSTNLNLSQKPGTPPSSLNPARTAAPSTKPISHGLCTAPGPVQMPIGIKRIRQGFERKRVYNLTVAESHCYYANGILVHNCDSFVWVVTQAILLGSGTPMMPSDSIIEGREGVPVDHYALAAAALAARSDAGNLIFNLAEAESRAATPPPKPRPGMAQPILPANLPDIQVCQNCRYRDRLSSMCVIQSRKVAGLDSCQSWSWDGVGGGQ